MNKKSYKVVLNMLIAFGICLLLGLIVSQDALALIASIGFFAAIILFFIGLGMVILSSNKEVGDGLMIGSLLIGIIGFGICTANFKI
jgi:amino acid transporter